MILRFLIKLFGNWEGKDLEGVDVIVHLQNFKEVLPWLQDLVHISFVILLLDVKHERLVDVLLEQISRCCVELSVTF